MSLFPYSGVNSLIASGFLVVYPTACPKQKKNCPTVCLTDEPYENKKGEWYVIGGLLKFACVKTRPQTFSSNYLC